MNLLAEMLHAKHCIRILIAVAMMMEWSAVGVAAATQDLQEHLSIPIRWCAMQGSPAVEHASAARSISTDEVLSGRHTRATVFVWMPRSGVSFRSALTNEMRNRTGFPLIKDPRPPTRGRIWRPRLRRGHSVSLPGSEQTQ